MEMQWLVSMPKVELHAHLNGSIRDSTLLELARVLGEKGGVVFSEVEHVILKNDRSLQEVFKLFDLIHILTTDHETITRIAKEVVEDFANENVVYLELRTTPKRNDSRGMTKQSYIRAVIEGLKAVNAVDVVLAPYFTSKESHANCPAVNNQSMKITKRKIHVGLLLSIDRRETIDAAIETVKLAIEMRDSGVAGVDLSGNPTVGEWMTFLPALRLAREQSLPITLHCGEVPNREEINAMLDFMPQRIGHACFLDEEEWRKLKASKIPVEICLTSNILTASVPSIEVHHFADLYSAEHPLVLCTDDSGVFSTTLSAEYMLVASTFGLGKRELFQLSRNAIEFIFAHDGIKMELRRIFDLAATEMNI